MCSKTAVSTGMFGITEFSVLMQIRAAILNDLARYISADYYSSSAHSTKFTIFEVENLTKIRNLARIDFYLAKELAEENDRHPTFTPRDVSATEVLNAVGYYLMFLGMDEDQRTPHRLSRMGMAEAKLNDALNLYVHHLDGDEARLIVAALAASNAAAFAMTEPPASPSINPIADNNGELTDASTSTIQDDKTLDFDLLATRDQLLNAFESWGLKPSWFRELGSHSWLMAARRFKGRGQRSHIIEPLFCPLAVMEGLATSIRGRARLSLTKGWDILDRHFPNVSHANSFADPREQTG